MDMKCYLIKDKHNNHYYYPGVQDVLLHTRKNLSKEQMFEGTWKNEKDIKFCLINDRETASNLMQAIAKFGRMDLELLEVEITEEHYNLIQEDLLRSAKGQRGIKP